MPKGIAVLNFDQFREFNSTGLIPQFSVDNQQIPAYAFSGVKKQFGAAKEWKLFPAKISLTDLLYLYQRCDIAENAVDTIPRDVWSKGFTVKVVGASGKEVKKSPLETAIWELNKAHKVKARFEEAHRYARLFGMGLVVMGLADGKRFEEPVEKTQKLTYLRVFSRKEISNIIYDKDDTSETYGDIKNYKITVSGDEQVSFWVSADRCIHVMEKTTHKSPWGKSILESPYDLFQVLKNTDWSAGEAYYQNASPLFVLSWEGEEVPTKEELDAAKEDLEDIHVKKRFIKPATWRLDTVQGSGTLPDPGNVWGPVVERIAGAVKIPKQLLLGTSAGALASGEVNLQQYYKDVAGWQSNFAEPLLLEFYGRLQEWGVLPEGDFDLEWTPLWEMSEADRAELQHRKMQTAVLALGEPARGVPALMTVEEAREQILGLNPQIGAGRLPTMKTEEKE